MCDMRYWRTVPLLYLNIILFSQLYNMRMQCSEYEKVNGRLKTMIPVIEFYVR